MSDLLTLIVGLLIAAGLFALAFATFRRGQIQAEADRLGAERQSKLASATAQRTIEDIAHRHAAAALAETNARLGALEAHVNALYAQAPAASVAAGPVPTA